MIGPKHPRSQTDHETGSLPCVRSGIGRTNPRHDSAMDRSRWYLDATVLDAEFVPSYHPSFFSCKTWLTRAHTAKKDWQIPHLAAP